MNVKDRIDELCRNLNAAIDVYYNQHQELMSNAEFDSNMILLEKLQNEANYHPDNSPIGKVGAAVRDSEQREVVHELRARSLDKTKDPKEIVTRLSSGLSYTEDVMCMWKLDGCTVVLTYVDNRLVLAATRGDGEIGTDITANVKYIAGVPNVITGLQGRKLIVRGECIISYADFAEINANLPEGQQEYANPRNLASASVSVLDPEDIKDRHLTFKAFDAVWTDGEYMSNMSDQFDYLKQNGFGVVEHRVDCISNIEDVIQKFTEDVKTYQYPVDGLVFALNDRNLSKNLPGTEHHPDPKYGYAFKWADEEVETTLTAIEWSPSRTGLLNPVAIFDPVQIAGTTVSRASLHNITQMHNILGPHPFVGEKILVMKANMVIPIVTKGFWKDVYSS